MPPSDDGRLKNFDFKKLDALTQGYITRGELAGTVTLVSYEGKTIHFRCQGEMSLETGQLMQKDTIFRLYSMTKPITSVAALLLLDKGKFNLDTPISEFLPGFKDTKVFLSGTASAYETIKPGREINMGDLLGHTSGLTYDFKRKTVVDALYRNAHIKSFNPTYPLNNLIKRVAGMPLQFSPGAFWSYGLSTDVLGGVIEVISGQTLREFFKQEIFDPLEMVDTDFYVPKDKQGRFAANYICNLTKNPTKLTLCDDHRTGWHSQPPRAYSGGAGLVSTAEDYLKFASLFLNKGQHNKRRLLKPETVTLMTQNHIPPDWLDSIYAHEGKYLVPGQGFGLGVGVTINPTFTKDLGNPGTFGWAGAAHTLFFVDPQEELIAILLTQLLPYDAKPDLLQGFKRAVYESLKAS